MDIRVAIERWRASEKAETAAIVLADDDLQRVLAAWPMADRKTPAEVSGESWADLWREVVVDEPQLLEMTGLQTGRALQAWRRAVALRLVYPDGSLHRYGEMVLRKKLKDSLGGK